MGGRQNILAKTARRHARLTAEPEVRFRDRAPRSRFRQINAVVHRMPKFLFAAQAALSRLHRDVPEQKLNLLQFPSREVTQPRATATEVVGSKR